MSSQHQHLQKSQQGSDSKKPSLSYMYSTSDAQQISLSNPEQILYLQRTIGNYATRQLLGQKTKSPLIQRDPPRGPIKAAGISLGGDALEEFEEFLSEDAEEWRAELQEHGISGLYASEMDDDEIGYFAAYLAELYAKEDPTITPLELDLITEAVDRQDIENPSRDIIAAYPVIKDRLEGIDKIRETKSKQEQYDMVMNTMRDDEVDPINVDDYMNAQMYYENPPEDFPHTEELRERMESETFSWLLGEDMRGRDKIKEMATAIVVLEASKRDADKIKVDTFSATMGGATSSATAINQVLTVATAGETLSKIDSGTKGSKMMMDVSLKNLGMWLTGKTFAALAIGYDLIRAFKYHKTRRDGYKAAMDRVGMDEKGTTDLEPTTAESLMKLSVGDAAFYAWNKTKRAFNSTVVKIALKVTKWIAYAITMLSGGTTAVVTGTIALTADIVRALMNLGQQFKGVIKALSGTRGANRKKYAKQLVMLAVEGNADAIQTLWDVNPFDEAQLAMKGSWNATGGKLFGKSSAITTIPKPENIEEFTHLLTSKTGGGYNGKQIITLINAVAGTMKSK